mgnify:CR=1 FL=1
MSGHTPGPWRFYTEPQPNGCPIVGAKGLMVAMLAHSIHQQDQRDTAIANGRLVAAAPELLEALQAILPFIPITSAKEGGASAYSENVRAADKVRYAIAKATGETK